MAEVITIFTRGFMRNALIAGFAISLCAALLGGTLVLKRYSVIGDGLSHVGFGALAVASALRLAPLAVCIPVTAATAFLLLALNSATDTKVKGDAAVALLSTSALAIGVTVASLSGQTRDLNAYLFGSILAVSDSDTFLSVALAVPVLLLFILFYNKIFAVTFDEDFARATGVRAGLYNGVVALLTAVTIVLGMRMTGAMLISSLVVFPALTAMRVCRRFKSVTVVSAVVAVACFALGAVVSVMYNVPTGASIVLANGAAFAVFSAVRLWLRG